MSLERALELHRAGRLDEARALYGEILRADPGHVDALALSGQIDMARAGYAAALKKFAAARTRAPAFADAWMNEGNALRALGRPADALAAFERAAALAPDHALNLCNRGLAKLDLGDADGAVADIARAAEILPGEPAIRANLAVALKAAHRPHAALALFEALGSPGNAAAVRQDLLDHDGARVGYAIAISAEPGRLDVESNRLFAANYDPDATQAQIKALYAAWGARQTRPFAPHPNRKDPDRRLRVGFVSADFRRHSVRHFLWPLIANFPDAEAELFAYANFPGDGDEWTARYRARFGAWRRCAHAGDDALAAAIRDDAIDVLVDLSGHTQGNRLGAFARKPAPVQVTWLGYGGTTGLPAVDWYVGDPRLVPEGAEDAFVERVWRLPRTAFVYAPQDPMPDVASLPMRARPSHVREFLAHGALQRALFAALGQAARRDPRCAARVERAGLRGGSHRRLVPPALRRVGRGRRSPRPDRDLAAARDLGRLRADRRGARSVSAKRGRHDLRSFVDGRAERVVARPAAAGKVRGFDPGRVRSRRLGCRYRRRLCRPRDRRRIRCARACGTARGAARQAQDLGAGRRSRLRARLRGRVARHLARMVRRQTLMFR
jgi:tetratricopeptide (TPR) repeat protein